MAPWIQWLQIRLSVAASFPERDYMVYVVVERELLAAPARATPAKLLADFLFHRWRHAPLLHGHSRSALATTPARRADVPVWFEQLLTVLEQPVSALRAPPSDEPSQTDDGHHRHQAA